MNQPSDFGEKFARAAREGAKIRAAAGPWAGPGAFKRVLNSASLVHPREVFRPATVAGAAAVIVAHNHPSGDLVPSSEDRTATDRLVKAGALLGIPLRDHVIIAEAPGRYSFREAGVLGP